MQVNTFSPHLERKKNVLVKKANEQFELEKLIEKCRMIERFRCKSEETVV